MRHGSLASGLPKARKAPQQQRSRFMVATIKDACRKLIHAGDASRLNMAELSRTAGVAIGSIYQYYPNLHAIVAEVVLEDAHDEVYGRMASARLWYDGLSLDEALQQLVRMVLAYYRRLLAIDAEFFKAYIEEFDLSRVFIALSGDPNGPVENNKRIYRATHHAQGDPGLDVRAFVVDRMLAGVVFDTLRQRPGYLFEPAFEAALVAGLRAAFKPAT